MAAMFYMAAKIYTLHGRKKALEVGSILIHGINLLHCSDLIHGSNLIYGRKKH
jgi:hypothetical protein